MDVFRIKKLMQMNDHVSHHRVVDAALCGGLPGHECGFVVRKNADNIELVQIPELMTIEFGQLATKNEVKKLRLF